MFWSILVAFGVVLITAGPASADLVVLDLNTPGDGLITRDTATGLDWLDVTQTSNLSYNDVIGGAGGWVAAGWRHATGAEICNLFGNYALAPSPCPSGTGATSSGDLTSVLIGLLGATAGIGGPPCSSCAEWTAGLYDDGGGSFIGQALLDFRQPNLTPPISAAEVTDNAVGSNELPPPPDVPDLSNRGHFLVRGAPDICGNGAIGAGESCDDNNTDNGDGCSSSCQVENGYFCHSLPSTCFELASCIPDPGSGLRFDGIDDLVTFGTVSSLPQHTIEAWVKQGADGGPIQLIAGHVNGPSIGSCGRGFFLHSRDQGNGQRTAYQADPSSCGGGPYAVDPTSSLDTWTHFAATYDGSLGRLYRNGVEVDQAEMTLATSNWMTAGANQFNSSYTWLFSGTLDELRIWNFPRSVEQIQDTMFNSLAGTEAGLEGYWKMDEGSGQQVVDSSASGTTGLLGTNANVEARDPVWVTSEAPICLDPATSVSSLSAEAMAVLTCLLLTAGLYLRRKWPLNLG